VSRIWRELKQAEHSKSRTALQDAPKIEHANSFEADRHPEKASDKTSAAERRAGRRRSHQFPLLVYGSNADKQPFHEETETQEISEDGCSFFIETAVISGQRLFLANKVNQAEHAVRVIHVSPRVKGKTRVGVEFLRSVPEFWLAR
jgi:hypothetical protein